MGISLSFTPFFDACYKSNALQGSMMVLGSQMLHDSTESIIEFAERNNHSDLAQKPELRTYFKDRYKISDYTDCDMNGQADLELDISIPVMDKLRGVFDIVLDAGTMEHIFDIASCCRNIHDLARSGGVIIHISPVSWHNHAFFNFNPVTFDRIAKANHYEIMAAAYHYTPAGCFFRKNRRPKVVFANGNDYVGDVFRDRYTLNNVLYMVAYKKNSAKGFVMPYDVAED